MHCLVRTLHTTLCALPYPTLGALLYHTRGLVLTRSTAGLEREASQANLYMASAAEDLRSLEACDEEAEELEGEGGEGPERTAKSARRGKSLATLDVEAAHKGAPPGLSTCCISACGGPTRSPVLT